MDGEAGGSQGQVTGLSGPSKKSPQGPGLMPWGEGGYRMKATWYPVMTCGKWRGWMEGRL